MSLFLFKMIISILIKIVSLKIEKSIPKNEIIHLQSISIPTFKQLFRIFARPRMYFIF